MLPKTILAGPAGARELVDAVQARLAASADEEHEGRGELAVLDLRANPGVQLREGVTQSIDRLAHRQHLTILPRSAEWPAEDTP